MEGNTCTHVEGVGRDVPWACMQAGRQAYPGQVEVVHEAHHKKQHHRQPLCVGDEHSGACHDDLDEEVQRLHPRGRGGEGAAAAVVLVLGLFVGDTLTTHRYEAGTHITLTPAYTHHT